MKYLVYDKNLIQKEMIYCNKNGKETSEDIAKAIVSEIFVGKFIVNEHTAVDTPIKNDSDMYMLRDMEGRVHIWQIGSKISDYTDAIIPNLYWVRKIGIMFD